MKNWWHPAEFEKRQPFLAGRQRVIQAIRGYFTTAGFDEVETPIIQVSPGMEPHIMAFATMLEQAGGQDGLATLPRFLHTSPEFTMKKLLVAGAPKIFQICKTFRNRERGPLHHPEFTMIEWYRADETYWAIMNDCIGLLRHVATQNHITQFKHKEKESNPFGVWQMISVAEAFQHYADIDLLATAPNPHAPDADLLALESKRIGIEPHAGDRWDDIFFRIFDKKIEPHLGSPTPTILYDYPVSMAALSRTKADDPRLAERFEVYVAGLELANAFGELTDAGIQRQRFEQDMDLKQSIYGVRYPIDDDFIRALEYGMPESSGIALGVDRLVMLATGADHINQILWAPLQ